MLLTLAPLPLLRALGIVLLAAAGPLAILARRSQAHALLAQYEERLARDLAYLRIAASARGVVIAQASALIAAVIAVVARAYVPASVLTVLALSAGPWLSHQRARRTTRIEEQLDAWLFGLAATMRATPAPGQAIAYSSALIAPPLRDELETLIKEQRLGTALDEALARMGARIGSRTVQSALGTLRIGQASGGDIPTILERSAATLREMARLEGVVRTKTAESKAQAWLLGILPVPLITMLNWLDPTYLTPLLGSARGALIIAISVVLWLTSIVVARRILDVDI